MHNYVIIPKWKVA